jgi:putative peptide zinc metalloprotease protein
MKNRIARTLLITALGLLVAGGGPGRALAQEGEGGGGGDNVAIAINTRDGSSVFRISFRIVRVSGDIVDQGNAAVAVASCQDCQTVAIAFQVVLVFSDPSVVSPTNLALAMNIGCTSCETLASAYQYVLGTDGVVRFTPEGNRAIAEIRQALQALRHSDLSIWEIQEQLDLLANELQRILAEELVAAGPPETTYEEVGSVPPEETGTDPGEEGDEEEESPQPEGSPAEEISPSPEESPSPSASPVESPAA